MVELIPLEPEELTAFLQEAIPRYAEDLIQAGNASAETALDVARSQFEELLPEGANTPEQHLFAIWDPIRGEQVGVLWLGVRYEAGSPFAALYELFVSELHRRSGYATQALRALEGVVREMRLDTIRLHVFGHNHAARALYEKLGYAATNITMSKQVTT